MLKRGTSPEVREKLIGAAYVRIDGLTATDITGETFEIKGLEPECRRWDGNNSKTAVAINGEVWLGVYSEAKVEVRQALAEELGLERGFWVPCSNGETLYYSDMLKRIADPSYIPRQ